MRILIADDDEIIQQLLRKRLHDRGLNNVVVANNGAMAVKKAWDDPVDLAFVDINMPLKDGLQVLRELKQRSAETFICIVSAESSIANVKQALGAGADGFLVKPMDKERLNQIIDKFLSTKEKNEND